VNNKKGTKIYKKDDINKCTNNKGKEKRIKSRNKKEQTEIGGNK
jgi:hypothetical protein